MIRVQIIIRIIRVIRVQKNLVFKPPVSAPPRTKIREIRAIRVLKKYSCYPSIRVQKIQSDIRVQKSRVQNISWEHRNSSLVNSTLRPAATIQHSTFKTQHCAPRLRVKRYSCYLRYYLPSVSGPTANLVFKKLWAHRREQASVRVRSVCKNNIRVIRVIRVQKIQSDIRVQKSRVPHVSALLNYK